MSHNSGDAQGTSRATARNGRRVLALRRLDPYLLLIVLLSLLPMAPMLQPGYQWHAHDARHSVYFLFEFDRGIQDGNLYPRWQPDFAFGYGYPFFNIYGPLAFYAGEALHLAGLSLVDAVKAIFALSITLSGLAMYGFAKQVLGERGAPNGRSAAGLVAAVAYMVMPYRLVDLYVRAGLAESMAYVWVPLVLWGTWATLHRPRLSNVLGLALAYAALLFTHPLTVMLLTLILVFCVALLALARLKDEMPWRQLSRESILPLVGQVGHILLPTACGLALGVGLSAVFGLPAMTENRFVRLDQWYGGRYAWGGDFVEFFQLFSPRWGMGASVPGPDDQVSFQLGVVPVVLSLVAVVSLLAQRPPHPHLAPPPARRGEASSLSLTGRGQGEGPPPAHVGSEQGERSGTAARLILFFAVLAAMASFLMLAVSAPLWQALPLARLVQFPWRLLTLTVFSMAFLCGAVARGQRAPRGMVDVPTLVLVLLLLLGSLPYAHAEMVQQDVSLAGLMRFQQSADEMTGSTAWVRQIPDWSPLADFHVEGQPVTSRVDFQSLFRQRGDAFARTLELKAHRELVEYTAKRPFLLTFNVFYYPGWHAYLLEPDSGAVLRELPVALRGELGLITVRLPAGTGHVLLRLEDTPLRRLGTALTGTSLVLIAGLLIARLALRRDQGRRARADGAGQESLPGEGRWPDG